MTQRQTKLRDSGLIRALVGKGGRINWCLRPLVIVFCAVPPILITILCAIVHTADDAWPAQIFLGIASFCALLILGDRPLINPIQTLVFLFHWWFSWGPAICSWFYWLAGENGETRSFLEHDSGAIWVVAIGLPIYALGARLALKFAAHSRLGLRFLMPSGLLYSPKILVGWATVTASISFLAFFLGLFGLHAYSEVNYLGGKVTNSPILAALDSLGGVGQFALVGLLGYLVAPVNANWKALRPAVLLVAAGNLAVALQSGSKGLILLPAFYAAVSYFSYRQRAPWTAILLMGASYLLFVEPFVASTRRIARSQGLDDSQERSELFKEQLRGFEFTNPNWRDINVDSPFRGVYLRAVEVAERSSFADGPWKGQSLQDGISAIVPRFINPNKADSNMGNFFAQELGVSTSDDQLNNIAISIPFEFVGNYGFFAGVLSFGAIGIVWTLFICGIISEARLATHPLTPLFISSIMAIEGSFGQFVNSMKPLPFAFAAAWLVYFLTREQRPVTLRSVVPA